LPPGVKQGPVDCLLVPAHQIFGSEELSARAPAIASRIPGRFIRMSGQDAAKAGKNAGVVIRVSVGEEFVEGNLEIDDHMPPGLAGVPAHLPGMPHLEFPCTGRIG
jgi:NADH-quinone oxidoreductase subunit G